MQRSLAVWAAIVMTSIAFAGCTSGSGELDMLVTPSDDAVTEAFLFEATGPKFETYSWNFGDGAAAEGAEVEHLFGFTNGEVTVRVTGTNAGEEPVSIAREVSLGGSRNINPQGVLVSSTRWVDPGEPFLMDATESVDEDGDPLLFRWTCERKSDIVALAGNDVHEGLGGVPFGVDAWASTDENLSVATTDYGTDFCNSLSPTRDLDWSRENSAVGGSIPDSGGYVIEVFVRDPKGSPWVGRLNLFVSEPERLKPEPIRVVGPIVGTFEGGSGGSGDGLYYNGVTPPGQDESTPPPSEVAGDDGRTFDRYEYEFQLDISALKGDIKFSHSGENGEIVEYTVFKTGTTTEEFPAQNGDYSFGSKVLDNKRNGRPEEYVIAFTLEQGLDIDFKFELTLEHNLDPQKWYEPTF
jgi:hypothetical protein